MGGKEKNRAWWRPRKRTNRLENISLFDFPLVRIFSFIIVAFVATALWRISSEERLLQYGDTQPTELPAGTDLRVPVNHVQPGALLLFEYSDRARTRLVVTRGPDNEIEAGLAECTSCYRRSTEPNIAARGRVICRLCRAPMAMPDASHPNARGSCNLIRIPYHTQGDRVAISYDSVMAELRELSTPKSLNSK